MAHATRPSRITGRSGTSRAKSAARTAPAIATTKTIAMIGISTKAIAMPRTPNTSLKRRRIGKSTAQRRTFTTRATAVIARNATTTIAPSTRRMSMLSRFTRGDLLKFRRLELVRGPARGVRGQVFLRGPQSFIETSHGQRSAAALAKLRKIQEHGEPDEQGQ